MPKTKAQSTQRMLELANKFVYLCQAYPEKNIDQIINLYHVPPVDMNCAVWLAIDLGWIKTEERTEEVDETNIKGKVVGKKEVVVTYPIVIGKPETWQFGEVEVELENAITYAFVKLNAEEKDLEENYLGGQLNGYAPHDVLIAVKHLLDDGVLHEYEIEDGENAYIFYSLKENAGKNWGQKQFKTNPLTGEEQAEPKEPTDTASEQ